MISTSLQYGTARMIHNIPLGSRVKTRISKEEYGERLQAKENGVNIESMIKRMRSLVKYQRKGMRLM